MGGYIEHSTAARRRLRHRRACARRRRPSSPTSVAAGQPFFLYLAFKAPHLPQIPAPRHEGLFQGIPPWRPPSYNEADVSDKPPWVQNLAPAELGAARPDPHRPARDAAGGRRGDRRQSRLRHRRHHGAPAQPRRRRQHDRRLLLGQRLVLGRAPPARQEQPLRGGDPLADVRALSASSRRSSAPRIGSRSTSTWRRPSPSWRAWACRSCTTARACCACSTARSRAGGPTSSPRRGRAAIRGRSSARRSGSTPSSRSTPGNPGDALRDRALRPGGDPYELTNVASDPANAARIATMAARLRQLRPNWPIDSDPNGPDPEEDE